MLYQMKPSWSVGLLGRPLSPKGRLAGYQLRRESARRSLSSVPSKSSMDAAFFVFGLGMLAASSPSSWFVLGASVSTYGSRLARSVNRCDWCSYEPVMPATMARDGSSPSRGLVSLVDLVSYRTCLLYTSDAADERSSVDLGGRRI